jgi:hypothetical protein
MCQDRTKRRVNQSRNVRKPWVTVQLSGPNHLVHDLSERCELQVSSCLLSSLTNLRLYPGPPSGHRLRPKKPTPSRRGFPQPRCCGAKTIAEQTLGLQD